MDVTLSQLFREYELFHMVKNKTKDKARKAFSHLTAFAGDGAARDLSPAAVNRWQAWLATAAPNHQTKRPGLAPYTVKTTVGAAAAVFGWAMAQRGVDGRCEYGLVMNPFAEAQPVRVDAKAVRYYSEDEARDILAAASELRWKDPTRTLAWYAAIQMALDAGLRKNEITNLRWEDVDLDAGRIGIRHREDRFGVQWAWESKGRSEDDVPMGDALWASMERLRFLRPWRYPFIGRARYEHLAAGMPRPGREALWPLPESIRDNPVDNWRRDFQRILARANRNRQRAGLPEIADGDFHQLRKTYGTRLAMAGLPEKFVQQACRHASPETTRKYYIGMDRRQCDQAVRATINKLGGL